jgi:hypothetical protein
MKKIVVFESKQSNLREMFRTCPELALKHPSSEIGVGLGAIWNGLHAGGGFFENKRCKIYYQSINDIHPITWE